jgi:hypothetical protein
MRSVFWALVFVMRAGHFAWMAGWGAWLLLVTWIIFTGGSVFLPLFGGYLTFAYGNFLVGFAMVILGLPIGLSLAHFASVLLRMPGAAILVAITNMPGNEDLAARARL